MLPTVARTLLLVESAAVLGSTKLSGIVSAKGDAILASICWRLVWDLTKQSPKGSACTVSPRGNIKDQVPATPHILPLVPPSLVPKGRLYSTRRLGPFAFVR